MNNPSSFMAQRNESPSRDPPKSELSKAPKNSKAKKVVSKPKRRSNDKNNSDEKEGKRKSRRKQTEDIDEEEQKKESQSSNKNKRHTKFEEKRIYVDEYAKKIILKTGEFSFKCKLCPLEGEMWCENYRGHINSSDHRANTLEKDLESLDNLKKLLETNSNKRGKQRQKNEENNYENYESKLKHYMEFLVFAMTERFSFAQISRLGKYIQDLIVKKQYDFFHEFRFNEKEISKICSSCFGPALLENLKNELASTKFSFCVDNVTLAGNNYCALKVKYLSQIKDSLDLQASKIENKIIGVCDLGISSTGERIYQIIKEKLLVSEEIRSNLVGITHDDGSNLSGNNIGLYGLMKKDYPHIFNLNDPCHSLNLVLQSSLSSLPDEIMDFFEEIHQHFSSPQKKATFLQIQIDYIKEKKEREPRFTQEVNLLEKYSKTRWLSLGRSLNRLISLWDQLKLYITKLDPNLENKKFKSWYNALNSEEFYFKIIVLNYFVGKINKTNEAFQSCSLRIHCLKSKPRALLQNLVEFLLKEVYPLHKSR